MLLVPDFASTY